MAERSSEEWAGRALRFRVLWRRPDDLVDARRDAALGDRGGADRQTGYLRRLRRCDDHRSVPKGASDTDALVGVDLCAEGLRGLRDGGVHDYRGAEPLPATAGGAD